MIAYLLAVIFVGVSNAHSVRPTESIPTDRIVGGRSAFIQNYPYQVSLQYSGNHICGGSIISESYVVTAGHCIVASADRLSVRAGTSFFERGGTVHSVVKVKRHENYQTNRYGVPSNDVAVLKIANPFTIDATHRPIELFEANKQLSPGTNVVITGWGRTRNFGSPANQLQTVTIPIIERNTCDRAYRSFGGLPSGQICAGVYDKGGKDACQGDSGGPLAIGGRLAGIVSWGNDCALAFFPGVYTEVAFFRDWINKNAELS
ncbi:trypsin-1-like [Phymastichus coffea]|uniref:trypsin-1-like n=1 Tax=Phymastichus coffea TaxID=108790 RepID=UPI00273B2087|nr:trypsin-1-like [Phymastichus coffea]